jgi:hypothetical protein
MTMVITMANAAGERNAVVHRPSGAENWVVPEIELSQTAQLKSALVRMANNYVAKRLYGEFFCDGK